MLFPYDPVSSRNGTFTVVPLQNSSVTQSTNTDARSAKEETRYMSNLRIINVKHHSERWMSMVKQLRSAGITGYQRLDAIDGAQIDNNQLRSLVTTDAYMRITGKLPRKSHADISTVGQVACALSHQKAWRELIKSEKPMMTILEDDASIDPDILYRVYEASTKLPKDFDIALWGTIGYPTFTDPPNGFQKPWGRVKRFYGLHVYSISKKAAESLLARMGPLECQLDTWIFQMAEKLNLKIYAHYPSIVNQGTFPSTIQVRNDCIEYGILI